MAINEEVMIEHEARDEHDKSNIWQCYYPDLVEMRKLVEDRRVPKEKVDP